LDGCSVIICHGRGALAVKTMLVEEVVVEVGLAVVEVVEVVGAAAAEVVAEVEEAQEEVVVEAPGRRRPRTWRAPSCLA
jgi:hypothetical protein